MNALSIRPPHVFAAVSFALIAAMVLAVTVGQAIFFRAAVIERESIIVHDMVVALTNENLLPADFDRYKDPAAQRNFTTAFRPLTKVTGVVRIKLYNGKSRIIWSDSPKLVGTYLEKTREHLERMWTGEPSGVFRPGSRPSFAADDLPDVPLVEFYVPIQVGDRYGAVAVYRNAESLTAALQHGVVLLSLIVAVGGGALFFALFRLFRSVHRRQREAESQFAQLSSKHERIVQMEKLSAIGKMLAEIAHQFNNPLVGVVNLAQLAERDADKPDRVRELLGEIRKAGRHCSDFVQRMLRFTQLARCVPVPTELGELVRDTMDFYASSIGSATPMAFRAEGEALLAVDPVLMRHALFNLMHNAAQANPAGPVALELCAERRNGIEGWAVAVNDAGPGLSPDVMKNLFTPFFTTRKDSTGLGLAVAQEIVAMHGGRLRAENRPGGGARFVIWLPKKVTHEAENPARR